jgi:hypothetical protein
MSYEIADILPALLHARTTPGQRHADPTQDPEVMLWRQLLAEDPDLIKAKLREFDSRQDMFVRQVMAVD